MTTRLSVSTRSPYVVRCTAMMLSWQMACDCVVHDSYHGFSLSDVGLYILADFVLKFDPGGFIGLRHS
jgi:hypothetical protein